MPVPLPDPVTLSATVTEAITPSRSDTPSGADAPPPLVMAHGLLGAGRNWAGIARMLAQAETQPRTVHAPDLRNHGTSPWDEVMDYPAMAADLDRYITANCDGRADLLGHSMGGKAAMMLALLRPERVRRLIIVDIAPKTHPQTAFDGYLAAMMELDSSALESRKTADAALAAAVPDAMERGFVLTNLVRDPAGGFGWAPNLAVLRARLNEITGWPMMENTIRAADLPALFLCGGRSAYVDDADRPAIARLFPRAILSRLPEAGHWVHADAPVETAAAIRDFLDAAGPE